MKLKMITTCSTHTRVPFEADDTEEEAQSGGDSVSGDQ